MRWLWGGYATGRAHQQESGLRPRQGGLGGHQVGMPTSCPPPHEKEGTPPQRLQAAKRTPPRYAQSES